MPAFTATRKLAILDAAENLADLRVPPGSRLEKLRSDREGQCSIRINQQWRICFSWSDAGPYAEPRLRRLFPWTGMGELHFSRCTEKRWTWDIPHIAPAAGGGYWVLGPSRAEWVGHVGTANQAIALVLERLPAACGPAFVGTPDELAAYEASRDGVVD